MWQALELVGQMERYGVVGDVVTYTSLIKACGVRGGTDMPQLADDIFSSMSQVGVKPTELSFHALIHVHLRCIAEGEGEGEGQALGTTVNTITSSGSKDNTTTTSSLSGGSGRSSSSSNSSRSRRSCRVLEIVHSMQSVGLRPSLAVLKQGVISAVRGKDMNLALKLLQIIGSR